MHKEDSPFTLCGCILVLVFAALSIHAAEGHYLEATAICMAVAIGFAFYMGLVLSSGKNNISRQTIGRLYAQHMELRRLIRREPIECHLSEVEDFVDAIVESGAHLTNPDDRDHAESLKKFWWDALDAHSDVKYEAPDLARPSR